MADPTKLIWLRRLLHLKALFCFLVWGLPALFGPQALLGLFGLQVPADPIYLRVLGGLVVAVGLLYWLGARDPVRNLAIVKFGLVDNLIASGVIIGVAFTTGLAGWFFWISLGCTVAFTLAFVVLLPTAAKAA